MLRRALVFCASTTSLRPFVGPSPDFGPGFAIHSRNEKSEFQSKDAIFVARMGLWHGFDDITRFFTRHKISIPAPTYLASQAPQIKSNKKTVLPAVLCEGVSQPTTPTDASSPSPRDHHVISRQCAHIREFPVVLLTVSPPPGGPVRAGGGSLSTRASRVSPARLSSAELLSPWFPTLLLPPTTPWPYYASYRGRVTNDLRYFRILKCDISPRVRKFFSKKC